MKDKGYSEEDVKDWERLPMISNVITSGYFGAWLYYRDKRRDKIVNSELLDKVAEIFPKSFCTYCNQEACEGGMVGTIQECETIRMIKDVIDGIIEDMKAEVSEWKK